MNHVNREASVFQNHKLINSLILIVLAVVMVTVAVFVLAARKEVEPVLRDQPVLVPPPPPVDLELIYDLLPADSIMAISAPEYVPVEEAEAFMNDREQVISVVINGDARAFPLPILSRHEIVNDVIGGEPVAVTWCPLCYTALVFSRQVDGQEELLTFGVSGKLLYNTLVMFDRQSESLWSQLYGAAIDGSLTGTRLSFFSSTLSEWQAWREQYPEGSVLSKPIICAQFDCGTYATNPRGSYDIDPYAGYYNSDDEGVVFSNIPRDEGAASGRPKERVLGLRIAGVERAYPFQLLAAKRLLNDEVNREPVLIWFDPDTSTGIAFSRRVDDQILTFKSSPESPELLIDDQSGSQWSVLTGTAVSGKHRGQRLSPLVITTAFEFGWFSYFPQSERYETLGDRAKNPVSVVE
jgi:hypothetical protein